MSGFKLRIFFFFKPLMRPTCEKLLKNGQLDKFCWVNKLAKDNTCFRVVFTSGLGRGLITAMCWPSVPIFTVGMKGRRDVLERGEERWMGNRSIPVTGLGKAGYSPAFAPSHPLPVCWLSWSPPQHGPPSATHMHFPSTQWERIHCHGSLRTSTIWLLQYAAESSSYNLVDLPYISSLCTPQCLI